MNASRHESGLTLIEVMIAATVAGFLTWTLLALAHHGIRVAQALNARAVAASAADSLQERLESDAAGAWAVWVPANDILKNTNSDGHELDFLSQDASHRVYAWAYRFDAASSLVTRYAYATGAAPLAGEIYGPLATFQASEFAVSELRNAASSFYDPLFVNANMAAYTYPLTSIAGAHGGNAIVRIRIGGVGVAIDDAIASATAPAHFTIIATYTPTPVPAATATPTPLPLVHF